MDVPDIVEVDEEGDIENTEGKGEQEHGQGTAGDISPHLIKKDEGSSPTKEVK